MIIYVCAISTVLELIVNLSPKHTVVVHEEFSLEATSTEVRQEGAIHYSTRK